MSTNNIKHQTVTFANVSYGYPRGLPGWSYVCRGWKRQRPSPPVRGPYSPMSINIILMEYHNALKCKFLLWFVRKFRECKCLNIESLFWYVLRVKVDRTYTTSLSPVFKMHFCSYFSFHCLHLKVESMQTILYCVKTNEKHSRDLQNLERQIMMLWTQIIL